MRRALGLLPLLVACAAPAGRTDLDREVLAFKAENERIRAEDLGREYEDQKRKADALAAQLIGVQRERERLYGEYDALRGELATLRRQRAALAAEVEAAKAALAALEAEAQQLATALEQGKIAAERLRARALEAQGGRAPG